MVRKREENLFLFFVTDTYYNFNGKNLKIEVASCNINRSERCVCTKYSERDITGSLFLVTIQANEFEK